MTNTSPMLINFSHIIKKYNLKPEGILHVGAHLGEEVQDYLNEGITKIILVEAIGEKVNQLLNQRLQFNPPIEIKIINACVSDCEEEVMFNITNNGQSSSMLELGTHIQEHPDVYIVRREKMKTQRLDKLITAIDYPYFLNMDIQGAELKALKGMGDLLKNCIAVYTEVNVKELYKGCALLPEIDAYLESVGFTGVEEQISGHGWGDKLYLRK